MLFLSQLVVLPPFERELDVVLLALFCATTKKDDYLLSFFPKIHTIAGTKIDLTFVNASPNTLGIGEVSLVLRGIEPSSPSSWPRRSTCRTTHETDCDRHGRYTRGCQLSFLW